MKIDDIASPHSSKILCSIRIGMVVTVAVIGFWMTGDSISTLARETWNQQREALQIFTRENYGLTVALFIAFSCLTTVLLLPLDLVVALAGGYLFGNWFGTLYVVAGATLGAILTFLAARYAFYPMVNRRFGTFLPEFQKKVSRNPFGYLLAFRLIPLIPFSLINLLAGLTPMTLRTFTGGTILGIFPCSFLLVYSGHHLSRSSSLADMVSPLSIAVLTAIGIFVLIMAGTHRLVQGKESPDSGSSLPQVHLLTRPCLPAIKEIPRYVHRSAIGGSHVSSQSL